MLGGLAPRYDYEIVLVNDGSTDRSREILITLARQDLHVRVVDLSRNFGHQFAITAGIDYAAGDAVVILDSDLQDPPEVIPQMIAKWEEGFKVVYGVRSERAGESCFKRVTASLFYRCLQRLSKTRMPLDAGDFRLMDRSVVDVVKTMREEHRYLRGIVSWAGFPQAAVGYKRDRRYAGKSKHSTAVMARLAIDAVFSFSAVPLVLITYLGIGVTVLSLLLLCWIAYAKLVMPSGSLTGWTALSALVLFLGGVQLLSIGVLGQYVGRIFEQSKQRPLYIVAQTFGFPQKPDAVSTKIDASGSKA